MAEDGEDIHSASSIEQYRADNDYQGVIWSLVDINLSKYIGDAIKLNITLPKFLISKIDNTVKNDAWYASRSNFLAQAVS